MIFNINLLDTTDLSSSTIEDYKNKLTKINEILTENNVKSLRNHKKIIDLIYEKYHNSNTRVSFISALIKILTLMKKTKIILFKKLKEEVIIQNKIWLSQPKIEKTVIKNLKSDYETNKNNFIKSLNSSSNFNDLITGLFLLFPRRNDYLKMQYVKSINHTSSKTDNFLVKDDGDFYLIFNDYKTKNAYGKQSFKIKDSNLIKVLNLIINEIDLGDYIYNKSRQSFFKLLKKSTLNIFGESIAINDIRKLHSTSKFGKLMKDINDDSKKMGHSVSTKMKFYIF
jgi:hypothetical protein